MHDVIIVGSGPAGASTALHLAQVAPRLAKRTLVLERDRHPRHKLCGGGCTPDTDVCLGRLGLDIDDVPHVKVPWVHLHFLGRGFRMRVRPGSENAIRVVARNEFDAWLVDKVRERGVEVLEETRVTGLHPIDGGVAVETNRGSYEARVVVGADGSNSVVRKLVAPKSPSRVARLVELFTPPSPPGDTPPVADHDAYLEFSCVGRGVQGYVWRFATQRAGVAMCNWGAYDSRVVLKKSSGSLKPVVADWLAEHSHRLSDYKLEGHPIRLFDRKGPLSSSHALLVGDAAGADPVFGEGIALAVGYGELGAAAIHDAFARSDFSFSAYRERVLQSPLGKSLRRRTVIAGLAYRLPSPLGQKLICWHLGPVLRWYLQRYVFNWSEHS